MSSSSSHDPTFRVEHLFGSKTRARLLGLFIQNADQRYFVRELTRKIDAQLNSVRRELGNLMEMGLIQEVVAVEDPKEKKGVSSEKRKFYQANKEFALFADLRSLLKKIQLLMKKNLVQEIDAHGKVDLLILTGRFVDNPDVPVDLLVIGEIQEPLLQKLLGEFEREFGQEVNFTVMAKDEYLYRKQVSDRFLYSILNAEHMVMLDRLKGQPKV